MTVPIAPLLDSKGTPITIHVESDSIVCPCLTPEGYRDPHWHKKNPNAPECNDAGFIAGGLTYGPYQGLILPVSGRGQINWLTEAFGQIQTDDRVVVLPPPPTLTIDFTQWGFAEENYLFWNNTKYGVIGNSLIPDPTNTTVFHHWELAARVLSNIKQF